MTISWEIAQLALSQMRLSFAGPVALDYPAVFQLLDELGVCDRLDRERTFRRILEVFDVVMSYQDLYRERRRQQVEAEAELKRASAITRGRQ